MGISIIIIIILIILFIGVVYLVFYLKKPRTDLEIDHAKLLKSDKINRQKKEIVEKSQNETDTFIKDKLNKIDGMLKKEQENHKEL